MSQIDELKKDNHIADFSDGKKSASSTDPELLQLEETILRLKQNMPSNSPDSATTKQMLVRLKARMKREEETPKVPFWKKLLDFQANPQVGMILAVATVLIFAMVTIPSIQFGGETITGTANNKTSYVLIGGVVSAIVFVYWLVRRK